MQSSSRNDIILSAVLRKARRDRAKDDILYFAEYYLPHILSDNTPLFHREIYRLLFTENRLCIAAPRGFAKSTITQIIYGLYCLLFNAEEDILTVSKSSSLADDWIRKIKNELENNERIKNDFSPILQWGEKESKKWTANHIMLHQNQSIFSQIRARGQGCQVRGLRPTKVIVDDLEDDELVRSEEQRKFLKEWFLGSLLNVLRNKQQLVVIGTVLHPLALLGSIIDKKDEFAGWTTRKYKALENGKSLWEARFPVKDLLKRKSEIGIYRFEAEFQNNPIGSDVCLWKPDWIKRYDALPRNIVRKFVALDPAISTKTYADYSALVCMGEDDNGNIYEIDSIQGKWGIWDLIDNCIRFYLKHDPIRFGIEEVAFQSVVKDLLLQEGKKHNIRIPIEKVSLGRYTGTEKEKKVSTDKFTRAYSIVHFFEQGYVYLKTQDLIDQVVVFPTGDHDDLVDAMVYALMLLKKYSPVKVMISRENNPIGIGNKSFTIEDGYMPCLAPPPVLTINENSWKIG